jgi:hypothetical protein
MNVTRWSFSVLALSVAGLAGCSDRPAPTELDATETQPPSLGTGPVALLAAGDPTAIPIGPPARIELSGRARASRRTIVFPQSAPDVNVEQLGQAARDWLAREKARKKTARDRRTAHTVQSIEQALAAQTPEEIRAALGPTREKVVGARSVRPVAPGLFEHTASYSLDGRDVLRIVTRAGSRERASFDCVDDPRSSTGDDCADPYDPDFDPEPVVADVAAMQATLDATSAEMAALEAVVRPEPTRCQADRAAYVGGMLAFGWKAGEVIWFAWSRNVPKTYSSLRDASILYGTTYALFLRYKACVIGKTPDD